MRTSRIFAFIASLIFAMIATPAHASFQETMEYALKAAGGNPDNIEMLRYAIYNPTNGAQILDRGIKQDYPYFALIGVAKAAKKTGKFSEKDCLLPTTFIDGKFDDANQYITTQEGQAKTNEMVSALKSYADQYRAQASAEAKQAIKDKAAELIPYYADLPVICHFAFNSNFQTEKDIGFIASELVKTASRAYTQFDNGDYVDGVGTVMTMGLSKEVACTVLSNGLGATGIGSIPGYNSVFNGVCSGLLGKAYEFAAGAVEWGKEAAKDIYCTVAPWADCDSPNPPPPPPLTPSQIADKFCSGNGGVAFGNFGSPGFSFACSNNASCKGSTDANGVADMTCISSQAWHARNNEKFANVSADASAFYQRWLKVCIIDNCGPPLFLVAANQKALALKAHEANPNLDYGDAYSEYFADAGPAGQMMTAALNDQMWRVWPKRWESAQLALVDKLCHDDQCRYKVKANVAFAVGKMNSLHAANPDGLYYQGALGVLGKAAEQNDIEFLASLNRMASGASGQMKPANQLEYGRPIAPQDPNVRVTRLPPADGTMVTGIEGPSGPITPQVVEPMTPGGSSSQPTPSLTSRRPPPMDTAPMPTVQDPSAAPIKVFPGMVAPSEGTTEASPPAEGTTDGKKKGKKNKIDRKGERG